MLRIRIRTRALIGSRTTVNLQVLVTKNLGYLQSLVIKTCAGILEQSMGARNRVKIGLS
jgi:hypothetical protein